jgi:hypothetical protein
MLIKDSSDKKKTFPARALIFTPLYSSFLDFLGSPGRNQSTSKAGVTLEPEMTQHNSQDRLQIRK